MPDAFLHGELGDAAAAARSEWRDDEEAWTRAAVERWLHERTLLDVVREHMHRGDQVSVTFGQRVFSGPVGAVGSDVFSLSLLEGRVDVSAAPGARFLLRVESLARSGGERGGGVTTMRARLLELETTRCDVEIGSERGEVVRGALCVGRDHVVVRSPGSGDAVVPIAAVAWVSAGSFSPR